MRLKLTSDMTKRGDKIAYIAYRLLYEVAEGIPSDPNMFLGLLGYEG